MLGPQALAADDNSASVDDGVPLAQARANVKFAVVAPASPNTACGERHFLSSTLLDGGVASVDEYGVPHTCASSFVGPASNPRGFLADSLNHSPASMPSDIMGITAGVTTDVDAWFI